MIKLYFNSLQSLMNKKKRFIVTGGCTYGVSNHGDDAMLSCLIRGLNKKYKNPEIIFLARHPNKKFDNLFKFKSLKNLDHDHKDLAKNRFFLGMNSNDKTYHLKKISLKKTLLNLVKHDSLYWLFFNHLFFWHI